MSSPKKKLGKPRKFNSPEELEACVDKYFADCEYLEKPPTMSGLAYAMGIDRKTLINYSKKEDYFPTYKKARDRVEASMEDLLLSGKATAGVIFSFKNNFGWADKQPEQEDSEKSNSSVTINIVKDEGLRNE
jgi:hypothetical protein